MHFESRIHELLLVKNAAEAAERIQKKDLKSNSVMQWSYKKCQFLCVPNGHIDAPFSEIAILKKETDGSYTELDHITVCLIKEINKLKTIITEAQAALPDGKVKLMIGEPKGDETAIFICTDCKKRFKGNVKEQLKLDQEAGYSICTNCR